MDDRVDHVKQAATIKSLKNPGKNPSIHTNNAATFIGKMQYPNKQTL